MAEKNYEGIIEESSLRLYLHYKYLPLSQYSRIISSVDNIFGSLARIYWRDIYQDEIPPIYFGDINDNVHYLPPLCLLESRTGNSITDRFHFENSYLPRIDFDDNEKLQIYLPKWSAVLVITGYVITSFQDFQINELQKDNLRLQNEKLRKEVRSLDLEKLNQKNEATYNLNIQLNSFHKEIHRSNIDTVIVNNQEIKSQ